MKKDNKTDEIVMIVILSIATIMAGLYTLINNPKTYNPPINVVEGSINEDNLITSTTTSHTTTINSGYVVSLNSVVTTTTVSIEENTEYVVEYYYEEEPTTIYEDTSYFIMDLTYYSGDWNCYGYSGTTLLNDYSVACNSFPQGTIIHIESLDGTIYGDYRVDDIGEMPYNTIDIFYSDYSYVPYEFAQNGRIECKVWIVE